MKNATLMVSAFGNRIYLGTMKKNTKFPVMNENRVDFTEKVIRAAAEHMMSMDEGVGYEFPGHGKLVWIPEKSQSIESTESPSETADEEE